MANPELPSQDILETPTEGLAVPQATPLDGDVLLELPPPAEDVVVLARNPAEVEEAQGQLLVWADRKLQIEQAALTEAEQNLAQSKKLKIKTVKWAQQVTIAQGRMAYYGKLRAAIAAGYYIVPNFPVQTIAVRTTKKRLNTHTYQGTTAPPVRSELTPVGTGRYVAAEPEAHVRWDDSQSRHTTTVTGFKNFDFPFKLVKPKILKDLTEAMELGIFDEIGILPAQPAKAPRIPMPDPMILGIVKRRETSREFAVTFLISWWIDTRTL